MLHVSAMTEIIFIQLNDAPAPHKTSNSDNDLRWDTISWEIDQKGVERGQIREKKAQ